MTERIGVCGGCGAKFKIPPTFQGSKAKCNKCGGVVEIGGEAAAPAPVAADPKPAAGRSRGGSRAGGGRSKAGAAGSRGSRGRATRAGGRRGAAEAEEATGRGSRAGRGGRGEAKKDNTMMYAGIGVGVVVVGALAFFMLKKDDAPKEDTVAAANENDAPAVEPEVMAPTPKAESSEIDAAPEPAKPEAAPPPPPEPEPEVSTVDTSNPVLSFDPVPKPPTLSDEEWDALNAAVRKGYLESVRPGERNEAKKAVFDAGASSVPALINGLNGLDFNNDIDFRNAGSVVLAIQDISADMVKIPFKLDILEREANMESNLNIINQLLKYWSKYSSDEAFHDFVAKVEERRAKQSEQVDIEDW